MAGSRRVRETDLELPLMELLCALDIPLGAQVAEGPELLPPPADSALVYLQYSGGRLVGHAATCRQLSLTQGCCRAALREAEMMGCSLV